MHTKVCSVLFALALSVHAQDAYHQVYPGYEFGSRVQNQDTPAEYNYSYDVRDDTTGDRKSQQESRSGDQVRGRYSVLDADGSTRTVEYTVEADSGFNAIVRRDGDLISLPVPENRNYPHYEVDQRRPISQTMRDNQRNILNSRTRLAQDARTGNVVDLNSGFGAHPQLRNDQPYPQLRNDLPQVSNGLLRNFVDRNSQISNLARASSQGVNQEGYNGQEMTYQFTPTNRPHSTGPVHFPYHSLTHAARLNNARNQLGIRPAIPEVDVRTPTVLRANSNSNQNIQNMNQVSSTNYPPSTVFNPNQYVLQEQNGPTTPIAPTYGPTSQAVLESNNTRIALYAQHDLQFGARINQRISTNDESVTVDNAQYNYIPQHVYSQQLIDETQNHLGNIVVDQSINSPSTIEHYRFPANTVPLADGPNFFSRSAIDHATSPLLNIHHDLTHQVNSVHLNHDVLLN